MNDLDFETLQLHAAQEDPDVSSGARAIPIYATSSFVFDSAEHAANTFAGKITGNHQNQYGRMHNPTVKAFVDRLIALEGGKAGIGLCSGQAATTTTLLTLAQPNAHIVFSNQLFGGTFSVANKILAPWGCRFSIVEPNASAIAEAIETNSEKNTVAVWCETIANPSCDVPDIAAIAKVCNQQQVPLVVDNTWGCAGYLCKPLSLGADIVIHSATKWIGGHGTFIAGAIVEAGRFDWSLPKFPAFTNKDSRGRTYISRAGKTAFSLRAWDLGLFVMGMTLSPFEAFLSLQGLETLSLRVQCSCDSALALAKWLETHPRVKRVYYAGLLSNSCYQAAEKTLQNGFGAVLSFETKDKETAHNFLNKVKIASHLANIGDAKTVVICPWDTTHASLPAEARYAAGVTPELIRVSVGLESLKDLKEDINQALHL